MVTDAKQAKKRPIREPQSGVKSPESLRAAIREDLANTRLSYRAIADKHGCSYTLVAKINRQGWPDADSDGGEG